MRAKANRQSRLLAAIGDVYDAALDERLWAGIAPRIAAAFGGTSTALQVRGAAPGGPELVSMTPNYDAVALSTYASYYAARDVWVAGAMKYPPSTVLTSKDLISDEEIVRTEIYNDWMKPTGVFYLVGAIVPVAGSETGVLGVHRTRDLGPFGEAEKAAVGLFVPHLQRALQLRRRLAMIPREIPVVVDVNEPASLTLFGTAFGFLLVLVRLTSFSENEKRPNGTHAPVWFALDETRPLSFSAGPDGYPSER